MMKNITTKQLQSMLVDKLDQTERGYSTPYFRKHGDNAVQFTYFLNDGTRKNFLVTINEVDTMIII
jgi:CRISPR/Cas system endoribonuclease Cas6 (RAMP superfamily)